MDGTSNLKFDFSTEPNEMLFIGPLYNGVNWKLEYSSSLQEWTTVPPEAYQFSGTEIRIHLESFLPNTFFQIVLNNLEP